MTPLLSWALSVVVAIIAVVIGGVAGATDRVHYPGSKLAGYLMAVVLAVVALVLIATGPAAPPGDCTPIADELVLCRVDPAIPPPVPGGESP